MGSAVFAQLANQARERNAYEPPGRQASQDHEGFEIHSIVIYFIHQREPHGGRKLTGELRQMRLKICESGVERLSLCCRILKQQRASGSFD